MADPIPVVIEYERQVVSTAEGATLSAMLADLARLVETGPPGAVFRRIYGSETEADVEDLRRRVRRYDLELFGSGLLLSEETPVGVTDVRVINQDQVVVVLEEQGIKRRDGSDFESSDFDPDGTITREARSAYLKAFGEPLLFVSNPDLGEFERIAELAANIGVEVNRVDVASLPSFRTGRERDIVRFRVVALYIANLRSTLDEIASTGDFLRFRAQRPGGHNFSAQKVGDQRLRYFEERVAARKRRLENDPRRGKRRPNSRALRQLESERSKVKGQKAANNYLFEPEWAEHRPDSFASLRVVRGGGPLSQDPYGSNKGFEVLFQTNQFLLQTVSENTMERASLVETFGPTYLYLFGTKSRVWSYSGVLFDTEGLTWLNEWRQAYDRYTGGTQTARLRARCFLTYDNVVREGIIIATNIGKTIGQFGWAQFSFQMFILKEHYLDGEAVNELPADLPTFLNPKQATQTRDEQYDITMRDVTPERRQNLQGDQALKRSIRIEDGIFEGQRAAVEQQIKRDAFPDGRLARTSGTVRTDVTDATVRRASQAVVNEAQALADFRVANGRVVQSGSSRGQLSRVGSTGGD